MASQRSFVEFVVDQLDVDCGVTFKSMFGEYGLYSHGKLFASICDDRLLIKSTDGGRAYVGDVVEATCYPGAKPALWITDRIDDPAWLSELVRITAKELPEPKPKKKRKKKSS